MLPLHLAGNQATGIRASEPVAQYELGPFRNFTYLILDWTVKKAAIVDPQLDLDGPLADLESFGFELLAILLTHIHHDHIAGVPKLLKRFPGLPVLVHPPYGNLGYSSIRGLKNGEAISVGSLSVHVHHTPGHSAGECCYFFELGTPYLLTGDTLFIRDCGRTDFADGSNVEMFASLQRIKKLPPGTIILPGHHYASECASILSKEMKESPPLQCSSVEELAALP